MQCDRAAVVASMSVQPDALRLVNTLELQTFKRRESSVHCCCMQDSKEKRVTNDALSLDDPTVHYFFPEKENECGDVNSIAIKNQNINPNNLLL